MGIICYWSMQFSCDLGRAQANRASLGTGPPKKGFFPLQRRNRTEAGEGIQSETAMSSNALMRGSTFQGFQSSVGGDKKEQLNSTYGSQHFLNFKNRPPPRKLNRNNDGSPSPQKQSEQRQKMKRSLQLPRSKDVKDLFGVNLTKRIKKQDFIFGKLLGQGAYSQVFMVLHKRTGLLCSIKVLEKEKIRNLKVQQNIFRQIKIHLFLKHPHITPLYGCFSDHESIYLISELITDGSLFNLIQNNKKEGKKGFPMERVQDYVRQLTRALAHMHSYSLMHRDVKPQNLLVTFDYTLKLCDFGWSVYNPSQELRSTLCGTPLYLAPQLVCKEEYDEAIDIWALGVLAYELITNQIPFKIRNLKQLKKVASQEVNYALVTDQKAVSFIASALAKNKRDRSTIQQLKQHPFLNGQTES